MTQTKHPVVHNTGVRLNQLNVLLICLGFIITGMMFYTMYQTTRSVRRIVTVTSSYLTNQQAGGMLRDLSDTMSEEAVAFVQSGEPGLAHAYAGQMNALDEQASTYMYGTTDGAMADNAFRQAHDAYDRQKAIETKAMRLAAGTLPEPALKALPAFLQEMTLSEEEMALSAKEKKEEAMRLLNSEEYREYRETIRTQVDDNHRLSSAEGQRQTTESSEQVSDIVRRQSILVSFLIIVSALALLLNRNLIIAPIQKSVDNLDRREPIPVRGSYEMRHLAHVYNEILKDNNAQREELSFAATHDGLTGLLNRGAFDDIYRTMESEQIGILIADVDHFKQYNDNYGHDVGDRVLKMTAETLRKNFRKEDQICRIGGDEFCVLIPNIGFASRKEITNKVIRMNQELAELCADMAKVTISAGVAFWDRPNPGPSIFKDADKALLELKKTRDRRCAVYGE